MVNIQFLYDLGRLSCLGLEYTFTGFMEGKKNKKNKPVTLKTQERELPKFGPLKDTISYFTSH